MTFRLPLCNVKQITEWVQQELICPGDWLVTERSCTFWVKPAGVWSERASDGDEEQMWWRWTAAHLLHGELLAGLTGDERLQPATQTTATTTRRQHRRNFSTRLISLLTSSLYYCGLKTCCMMYFKSRVCLFLCLCNGFEGISSHFLLLLLLWPHGVPFSWTHYRYPILAQRSTWTGGWTD